MIGENQYLTVQVNNSMPTLTAFVVEPFGQYLRFISSKTKVFWDLFSCRFVVLSDGETATLIDIDLNKIALTVDCPVFFPLGMIKLVSKHRAQLIYTRNTKGGDEEAAAEKA